MRLFGSKVGLVICLGLLGGAGAAALMYFDRPSTPFLGAPAQASSWQVLQEQEQEPDRPNEISTISVRTIHPHRDASFSTSIEQPAFVDAYYQADLMARLAGPVKSIVHDIGDRVRAGEEVLQIDAPDLQAEVQQKESVIRQRQSELEVTRKNLKMVKATVDAAAALVNVKENEVNIALSTQSFREKELKRFRGLASGPSPAVTQDILDERIQFAESAVATTATARAAVDKAKADLAEAQAKLEAAIADIQLKESLVEVARKDRDKSKALLEFAIIRAPFDGVITRRRVDPGSFVQNAATHPDGLLTVARTDIVTVYMKVPDNFAPLVTKNSEAIIQMSSLPGMIIRARVTRFSPSLETPEHDRTMRVEVDLFNGSAAAFVAFLAKEKANNRADLKGRALPILPQVSGARTSSQALGLLPGQYGKMRLVLGGFQNAFLVPSTAVFSQGGNSFIFLLQDGRAVRTPVEIQADNGKTLKLALIERTGGNEVHKELTGSEEIVFSNQGELTNGQEIKPTLVEW